MWRAFFLSLGIVTCILGAECLVVDRFVLANGNEAAVTTLGGPRQSLASVQANPSEMVPPEWAPWSLMSTGAVVILYALTINRGGP